MARLIDADRLAKVMKDMAAIAAYPGNAKAAPASWAEAFEEFIDYIDAARTVDAVEVVRCKDCKHHIDEELGMVFCPMILVSWMGNNEFCSRGVRRTDDGN